MLTQLLQWGKQRCAGRRGMAPIGQVSARRWRYRCAAAYMCHPGRCGTPWSEANTEFFSAHLKSSSSHHATPPNPPTPSPFLSFSLSLSCGSASPRFAPAAFQRYPDRSLFCLFQFHEAVPDRLLRPRRLYPTKGAFRRFFYTKTKKWLPPQLRPRPSSPRTQSR